MYRLVRDGGWANVAVETVRDGVVVPGHLLGRELEQIARCILESAMKYNSDGKVNSGDFSKIAGYVA